MQGHTNEGTEEKNTGFPLKTGGKDRGGPAGMTKGQSRHAKRLAESRASLMQGHTIPAHVIPDVFNRESRAFPMQGHPNEGTEEKNTGFPLKTGGHDRRGPAGMTEGPEQA